jgi:hypothetical protein
MTGIVKQIPGPTAVAVVPIAECSDGCDPGCFFLLLGFFPIALFPYGRLFGLSFFIFPVYQHLSATRSHPSRVPDPLSGAS